jgi:hypothetical protein
MPYVKAADFGHQIWPHIIDYRRGERSNVSDFSWLAPGRRVLAGLDEDNFAT